MIPFKKLRKSKFFNSCIPSGQALPQVELTEAQINEFHRVFSEFDKDGSGTIDASELGDAMRSLGLNPTPVDLREMIQAVDLDASGTIDFAEFLGLMKHRLADEDDEEDIFQALRAFTADNAGATVEAAYLKKALTSTGEKMTAKEVDFIFDYVTISSDGMIDCKELSQVLTQ